MAEVRAAIDEADCFCFVVSPDSVESPVCREEAAHAAASNKRILPLVHRPVDDGLVPEAVAAHNWIEFEQDFDEAFATLVKALETEPEHLRTHTRLLVRSKEWEASGDRSQLLRGGDLSAAEAWLGASAGKEPAPTQGQTTYVLASRRAASRRQRTVVGAVALALVVSLVLSVVAVIQRGEAIAQREEAEAQRREAIEQRNLARSGDLSSASILQRERDPELGLLLAIEAARILRTDRSEEALRQAVRAAHLELLREGGELPGDLAFGPGGTWVASFDRDSVDTWDAATGETLLSIPTGGGAKAIPWGLAVDSRGRWIATAARGGTTIWDATTGELLRALPANGIVYQVEFSADGDRLVAGGDDGARLWDPATGEIVLEFGDEPSGTYGADISSDGALVATGHGDGIVRIWDGRTGKLRSQLRGHSDLGFFVRFSQRGDRLVSVSFDRTARVWDVRSGEQIAVLTHDTFVQDAAFIRDGFVVTGDSVGVIRIWNIATGETVSELWGHSRHISFLAVNQQQDRIVSASDDGSFRLWRLGAGVSSIDVDRSGFQTVAAFRGDGGAFLTAGYSRAIELWDATSGARIADLRLGGEVSVRSAAFSPDGSSIAVAARVGDLSGADGGAVMLIDASTGELAWSEPESGDEAPATVGFSPGGDRIVALWTDGHVRVYDARDGSINATYVPRQEARAESGPSLVAFAPDGRIVALVNRKDVVLWAPEDGTVSRTFRHDTPVRAVAFSPDGRSLAAGTKSATIRLWNVADGTLEATLTGHQGPIESVSFDPSGAFIVSAATDGTARVWNRQGEQIQVYQAGELFVTSAMFSPDGSQVLVGVVIGEDTVPDVVEHDVEIRSTTRVYSCELCLSFDGLLALAESRVTRDFTPEERATYLGEAP